MRITKRIAALPGHLTLRQQIALAAAALCVFVVAVIAAGTAWLSYGQTSAFIRQDLAATARVLADRLNRSLFSRYREVRIFAELAPLKPLWHGKPAALRAVLDQLQESYSEYSWIGFAGTDGTVLAGTQGMLEGSSVAARPWFLNGLGGSAVEDVHEAQLLSKLLGPGPSGEPFRFVDLAFPVRGSDGEVLGVLCAHLSWDFAASLRDSMLSTMDFSSGNELLVLARDGTALLGAAVNTNPFSKERIEAMRRQRSGTFVDEAGTMLAAFAVVESGADYPGLGWIVVARQPYAAALAPVGQLVWTISALGIAAAALGVLLAGFIAGRLARPIQALTREADRLGREGDVLMLSRHAGSVEVVRLSTALRSLLRRIGLAEQRTQEAELRASEGAEQYAHDVKILRRMADTDPLTNLMNRRAFLVVAEDAFQYFQRYERPIAMLVIDIDHFKQVNDSYGHAAGDAVIKRVGELIEDGLRTTDKAARFGGEEFIVLLREVDELGATALARRILEAVAERPIGYGREQIGVTASIGVALAAPSDRDVQDTIERADRGLYMAKNTGRNRVFLMHAAAEEISSQAA